MRSVGIVLLLVLFAAPLRAEERTWTISTGTYAMAAELVEVRGDIAYLKTADRIEHIPLARLSAADMQYLASQSPSVIFPGPADDPAVADSLPTPANEYNALSPGAAVGPVINDAAPRRPAVQRESQKPVTEFGSARANAGPRHASLHSIGRDAARPEFEHACDFTNAVYEPGGESRPAQVEQPERAAVDDFAKTDSKQPGEPKSFAERRASRPVRVSIATVKQASARPSSAVETDRPAVRRRSRARTRAGRSARRVLRRP